MFKKKNVLIVITPEQKRIQFMRIRASFIVILVIIFIGGICGFLIPFDSFTLDAIESNQKKHITDQNKRLLKKIRNMQEILFDLQKKITDFKQFKNEIEDIAQTSDAPKKKVKTVKKQEELSLDAILGYLNSIELFNKRFFNKIKENPSFINQIPVMGPVKGDFIVTAPFGEMKDPFTGDKKLHFGIDFSAKINTPVIASADGIVSLVENHRFFGKRIRIQHLYGFSTVYAHLGEVKVKTGQRIIKGEEIGSIGITGISIGPHLHYEILRHNTPINPEKYFYKKTTELTMAD